MSISTSKASEICWAILEKFAKLKVEIDRIEAGLERKESATTPEEELLPEQTERQIH